MSTNSLNLPTDPALHPDESAGTKSFRGVTRVLRDAGLMSEWEVSEAILERGSDVHKACQYYDERDLDLRTIPADYRARVRAWALFKQQTRFEIEMIETLIENPIYSYRGRLDRVGKFAGQGLRVVIDLKSGKPQPFTRLQTAAYACAVNSKELFRRIGLELRADGTFWMDEYPIGEYFDDVHTFLGALRVINFKKKFNL